MQVVSEKEEFVSRDESKQLADFGHFELSQFYFKEHKTQPLIFNLLHD